MYIRGLKSFGEAQVREQAMIRPDPRYEVCFQVTMIYNKGIKIRGRLVPAIGLEEFFYP